MVESYRYSILGSEQPVASRDWILEGLIAAGDIFGITGKPASAKSFGAVEMAIAVALGDTWFNVKCSRGSVVYIANERRWSVKARLSAGLGARGGENSASCKIAVLEDRALMTVEDWHERLRSTIDRVESETSTKVRLVVFDTLSASMPGLDENSAGVCSKIVDGLRGIADELDLAIGFVHHSNANDGPRGSSVLLAALDIQFAFKKSGEGFHVEIAKCSDGPSGAAFDFVLESFGDNGAVVPRLIGAGASQSGTHDGGGSRRRRTGINWQGEVESVIQQLGDNKGFTTRSAVLQELRERFQDVTDDARRKGLERGIRLMVSEGRLTVQGDLLHLSDGQAETDPCDKVRDKPCDNAVTDELVMNTGKVEGPVTVRDRVPKGPVSPALSQAPVPPTGTERAQTAGIGQLTSRSSTAPLAPSEEDHGFATRSWANGKARKARRAGRSAETDQQSFLCDLHGA